MSSKPPWWRAFDRVERAIGEPLENAAASNRYVDVMLRGMRIQRAIGGGVGRLAGGATGRVLHMANIPTRADIRRLNRQLSVLTSEVRALSVEQREALTYEARTDASSPLDRSSQGGASKRATAQAPRKREGGTAKPSPASAESSRAPER